MTLIACPITLDDPGDLPIALAHAHRAKALGADLVEFRIDALFTGSDNPDEERAVLTLAAESPLPCIITCRTIREGGAYDGPDDARISLYERLGTADHPPRYLDLEQETFERSANIRQKVLLAVEHPEQRRSLHTSLILSIHDFSGRPGDLLRRISRLAAEPAAAVLKVAYRVRSLRDNLELLDLHADTGRPTIALGIGEFGLLSRVLAPKFGAFLTFASLDEASATAPGQPTLHDLLHLYHARDLTPQTQLYGVVGWPVAHSLSPAVHNAAFHATGHDGVYLPLPVAPGYEPFKATILALLDHPTLDFAGCSVTAPHKEHLVQLAREMQAAAPDHRQRWTIHGSAELCGSANTLTIERDEQRRPVAASVRSTDGPAAGDALRNALGPLANLRIAILGAGGAARAIALEAAADGATVILYNRTLQRAQQLASSLNPVVTGKIVAADWHSLPKSCAHAIINCTPLGQRGGPAETQSPLTAEELTHCNAPDRGTPPLVFDTVYTPLETPLLRNARAAGCPTIDGLAMFVRQAEAQFAEWTRLAPPQNLMKHAALAKLQNTPNPHTDSNHTPADP